tara:strand:+ start:1032 stop:1529 length:498 start_codon:yes stop_codon:yes gene_type:complete
MIKELIKIANELDAKGLQKEADVLDKLIKAAQEQPAQVDPEKQKQEIKKIKEEERKQAERAFNAVSAHVFQLTKKDPKDYKSPAFKWAIYDNPGDRLFYIYGTSAKASGELLSTPIQKQGAGDKIHQIVKQHIATLETKPRRGGVMASWKNRDEYYIVWELRDIK